MNTYHQFFRLSTGAALITMLFACGGGSDNPDQPPAPTPVMATLSGTVTVDGPIQNAVVCLDLNANNACDTD